MTNEEHVLWRELRRGSTGALFRRQVPILGYVVDFFCREHDLAIEVDGLVHELRSETDAQRDARLHAAGIVVLRFTNDEVVNELGRVVEEIRRAMEARGAARARRR